MKRSFSSVFKPTAHRCTSRIFATIAATAAAGLAGLLAVSPASAIECKPDEEPSACQPKKIGPWSNTLAGGFNLAKGNANTLLFNLGGATSYEKDEHIFKMTGDYRYGEAENERTLEIAQGSINYKNILNERWYVSVGDDVLHDGVAEVKYRSTTYAAPGYFILKDDQFQLGMDVGPAFIAQKQGSERSEFSALRGQELFDWKISESSKFFQSLTASMPFDDTTDTLLVAKIGIQAAINNRLSLQQLVQDTFDGVPAEGRKRNDVAVITSLLYSF